MGKQGCAALELDLLPWLYAGGASSDGSGSAQATSREEAARARPPTATSTAASLAGLQRGAEWKVSYEVLGYLGDGNWSEASLRQAQRTLDAIDVRARTSAVESRSYLPSNLPIPL